jgi:hypothetical protein
MEEVERQGRALFLRLKGVSDFSGVVADRRLHHLLQVAAKDN